MPPRPLAKMVLIPFFWFHYGGFLSAHLLFVLLLFGPFLNRSASFPDAASVWQVISRLQTGWAFLALLLSHAASFVLNYIGKGEYKRAELRDLMLQPYGRVVLLYTTILIGGILVISLGSPVFALLLLVVLKTFIDVQAHLREHREPVEKAPSPSVRSANSIDRG